MLNPPQNLHERSVTEVLRRRHLATVPVIARESALSPSTTVGVLTRLMERGLVFRQDATQGARRGRPSFAYGARLAGPLAAIEVDGSEASGAIFSPEFQVLGRAVIGVASLPDLAAAADVVRSLTLQMASAAGLKIEGQLLGAAIAFNAVRSRGRVLTSSVLPWLDHQAEDKLARLLGVPVTVVANAHVEAEQQALGDAPPRSFAYLHAGDGISGHFCIDGKPVEGANNHAGELGHITVEPGGPPCGCGRRGCLEAVCSGPAILRAIRYRGGASPQGWLAEAARERTSPRSAVEQLWQAWLSADADAVALMEPILDRLAWGLSVVMNIIDPEAVVAGGYLFEGKPGWVEEVAARAEAYTLHGGSRNLSLRPAQTAAEDRLRVIVRRYEDQTKRGTE